MSLNQSRAERSESSQCRRSGRPGSYSQPRNFSGGSGKGGGTVPPPFSSATNSSLSSNRSFKKSNNAQGGQARVSGGSVNSDSNNAVAAWGLQNGSHLQPPLHGTSSDSVTSITVKPITDLSAQKRAEVLPKTPSSHPSAVSSDYMAPAAPATPAKAQRDTSRSVPLQFGSISPGFVNGMQIPARTNSAPPNLDEQQRNQARHDSLKRVPAFPTPSVPKPQMPGKEMGLGDQSNSGEAYQMAKARRNVQVSSATPITQTHKTSVHSVSGVPMPVTFHQPPVHIQFGGPNPQIQSQAIAAASLPMPVPMPMPVPLPMGNSPPMQQPVFVPSLQPRPLQPQNIMHQGQSLNFTLQMGPQLPPHLGNLGINIGSQFTQQPAGKFGGSCKVKITHPDTHEELRLDKKADPCTDGGLSGLRTHPTVPQSQPIMSVPPAHSINYFPNSYNSSSVFFPASSSVPSTSVQINPSPQAPKFTYLVSQGPQTVSSVSPSTHYSYSGKNSAQTHSISEPSSLLGHSLDAYNSMPSAPSASVKVTVKPASVLHVDKITDSSVGCGSLSVEKGGPSTSLPQQREANSVQLQRDTETSLCSSSREPKPSLELTSSSLPVASKQSSALSSSAAEGAHPKSLASAPPPFVVNGIESRIGETMSMSDSIEDQPRKQIKKGHSQPQGAGQSTSILSLSSQSLECSNAVVSGTADIIETKRTASSSITEGTVDPTRDRQSTHTTASTDGLEYKTDSERQGSTLESSTTLSTAAGIESMDTDHHARKDDFSVLDEPLKLESLATKEQGGNMLSEELKQDKSSSEVSSESRPFEVLEGVNQTESHSLITYSHEVRAMKIAEKDSGEPMDHFKKDDVVPDNSVISTSLASDASSAQISSPGPILSTSLIEDNKNPNSDASSYTSDSLASTEAVVTKSVLSDEGTDTISTIPYATEPTFKEQGESTEGVDTGSSLAASFKDKPVLSRSKSSVTRGKKKRKEFLLKADAAGTTSDLYMAYKGPEEKKETVLALESTVSPSSIPVNQVYVASQDNVVSGEKGELCKAEPDDWEDAADISTPKFENVDNGMLVREESEHHCGDGNGLLGKRYSRDFLLKFSEQCADLPKDFESKSDFADAFWVSNVNASRDSHPGPGRIIDRPSGGSGRLDRRGSMVDDDSRSKIRGAVASGRDPRMDSYGGNFRPSQGGNFGVSRNPRAQTPAQYAGGILSGPMQSLGFQGGAQRNSPDLDRWQRATSFQKGLFPSPQPPVMHKAEKKYEVGKVTDEEQAKQRQLKAILNKLTPQNFYKLFEQVKAVNIDNAVTLRGVISQIFDKALMEPTFCEMYANFCYHLAGALPDFSADNEKITFKRLLLNKCQEEFERGEREQEEADRADEEGEVKQSEEEREEKRIQARRRMLGNIRLIGELYKKKMLTERIMHECIKKLLGQYQNPDEENIEALCKLMSTIGEIIDHPKAKEHMDAYFDMMSNLSNNMKLSSRVRFMLRDAIDLRKNRWQQRRKVEGPKKIEEVHRDAAQERQVQASRLARGPGSSPSVRNRAMDFSPRGATVSSSPNTQMGTFRGFSTQLRGFGIQDARLNDRNSFDNRTLSMPLPQRPLGEDSITLGPQGGLARGMSIRGQPSIPSIPSTPSQNPGDSRRIATGVNGYSSVSDRAAYGSREDLMPRYISDRFAGPAYDHSSLEDRNVTCGSRDLRNADRGVHRSRPTSPPISSQGQTHMEDVSSDKLWSEERLRDMSIAAIKEFYSAKDEKEVALCVKDLNAPSFYPSMISIWVSDSFERKDMERDILANLLINLSKSQYGMLNQDHLIKGFESVLATLEDAVNDAPKSGEFLGRIFAKIILENVLPFTEIGKIICEGGEEQGRLVEIGLAAEVVGTILETIKLEKGESVLNEIRTNSSLKLGNFRPPHWKKPLRLDKFI